MLQINNLTLTHIKDLNNLTEGFNLTLNKGDKAVIIGEEGNGKSTLLKWIYDPSLIDDYIEYQGSISFKGETLGYLMQELPKNITNQTIYEYFCDNEVFFDMSLNELKEMASNFGFDSDIYYSDQIISSLSGGEKIKIQLMNILVKKPSILLLDEPSNDIDIETLEFLEDLINDFYGIVLYISHDETLIENTANKIIHLERIIRKTKPKYTVVTMKYHDYMTSRNLLIERQNQKAASDLREKKIRDEKYNRVYQSVNHALKTVSRQDPATAKNLKDKMHSVKSMSKRFEREDAMMTKSVEVEEAINFKLDIANEIKEGKTVIDYSLDNLYTDDGKFLASNIYLNVKGPQKLTIIGKNGVGKTTLIKDIYKKLKDRPDLNIEYMPQNYLESLDENISAINYLNPVTKDDKTRVMTYLGALKFTIDEMNYPIRNLSGGQKAKLFLIKISLSEANLLILDEPTRNFSPLSQPVIREMLKGFKGAIISISHDRKYINEVSDVVMELKKDGLFLINN